MERVAEEQELAMRTGEVERGGHERQKKGRWAR